MINELYHKYKGNKSAVTVLNYVQDLSVTSGIPINADKIEALLFKDGKPAVTSPRDINKAFFSMTKESSGDINLTADQIAILTRLESDIKQQIIDRRRSDERSWLDQLAGYQRSIEELCRKIGENRGITIDSLNFVDMVNKICASGFYEFANTHRDSNGYTCLDLITQPVSLKHNNIPVAMGRYLVRFNPKRFNALVFPYDNSRYATGLDDIWLEDEPKHKDINRYYSTYYHPFIGGGGNICWGSAAEVAGQLAASGKWVDYLNLLSALLTTYPGGTPYAGLDRFYESATDRNGGRFYINADGISVLDPKSHAKYCEHCDKEYSTNPDAPNYSEHGEDVCFEYCPTCEDRLNIGDTCGHCSYCEHCEETYNPDSRSQSERHENCGSEESL